MFSKGLVQAVGSLLLALIVVVVAAPGAAAHPVPHQGGAVAAGAGGVADAAGDAASCCHVGGACSVTLCDDPAGALSRLSWSRAGLRPGAGAQDGLPAGGADPPPPRG